MTTLLDLAQDATFSEEVPDVVCRRGEDTWMRKGENDLIVNKDRKKPILSSTSVQLLL